ncbi:heme o synthase [Halalkalibacter alkalisediminis]|uniref:Protoheme IX farnesyltransferase n=1 Tax=Halalkalibacter alkalisediminis TaxID=935616 RepID=A0ABV6NCR8_9BACI|nr:heme o synthase [Halalkalibacter alkalisediminis]
MRLNKFPSLQWGESFYLISELTTLVKRGVLLSNVLPVFIGFWLALYFSNASFVNHLGVFFLTVIGSTFVIAGALILNNWYDVDIDQLMERTKNRPTVTGTIPLHVVFTLGIILTILGLILLLFTTVEATIYAFVGWFTYVVLYTMWSKRRYTLNTLIGSVSGAVTPLIGWAAIQPASTIVPIVLFLFLFIWQMPHTFAITIRKYEEYQAAGVAMLPVVHGFNVTKRQMVVYVGCLLPLPYYLTPLGTAFVVIATLLNVVWLALSLYGLFTRNDLKWARIMFLFSVNYLMIILILMIIVTLPISS